MAYRHGALSGLSRSGEVQHAGAEAVTTFIRSELSKHRGSQFLAEDPSGNLIELFQPAR